jgi:hypothetical protein
MLLLAWSLALLLPTILTPEGDSPHFTRLIAATPALAGLVAVGGLALAQTLNRAVYPAGAIVLALGLCFSMAASAYTFFGRWAALPDLYEAFMVQDWRAANWALEQSRTATVYISPELVSDPFHASFDLLLRGGPVRDFPGAGCLLYPDRDSRPLAYLTFVPRDPVTTDQVAALYPTGQALAPILRQPDAQVEYTRFQVPAGAASMPPAQPTDAVFGDALRLVGFELDPPQARAGETIHITLYWQALAAPLPEYVMFVHLYAPVPEGPSQPPLAQHDGAPCNQAWSTTRLAAGERVIDTRAVTIPTVYAGTKAVLAVGVYAWPSQVRLPVTGATPQLPDNRIVLSDVSIVRD